jgi:membrane protease YdiL (CAAX protease family)
MQNMQKLLGVIAVVVVIGGCSWLGWQLPRAGTASFWALVTAPTILLSGVALWRAHRDGDLKEIMRPQWGDFTRGFMGTLVLFAGAYAFTKVVAPTGSPRESWMARLYLQLGHPGALRANATLVACGMIVAAAAEEIVWRGMVTTLLAEQLGSRRAWIYGAVAYAAAHVPAMWALADPVAGLNPVLPLAALGAGLVWGAMARSFGRLPPAIVSHALFDWVVVMMFRLWGTSV